MLRVELIGNLGADPEVGVTRKSAPLVTLRVAVNQVRTDPATGERRENTEWFRVRAAGRLQTVAERLGKGTRVLVIGRLDLGHYQTREGESRTSLDVWADDLIPFGQPTTRAAAINSTRSPATHEPAPPSSQKDQSRARPRTDSQIAAEEGDDDDLPW